MLRRWAPVVLLCTTITQVGSAQSARFAQSDAETLKVAHGILLKAREFAANVAPEDRGTLVWNLVGAIALTGDITGAFETAAILLEEPERSKAFWPIAWAQAHAGDFGNALLTATRLPDSPMRAYTLKEIASMQAGAGDIGGALATIALLRTPTERLEAEQRIAEVCAESGKQDIARQLLQEAWKYAQKQAAILPREQQSALLGAWIHVAGARRRLGDTSSISVVLEAMRQFMDHETEPFEKARVQATFVMMLAGDGFVWEAMDLTSSLPAGRERDNSLDSIALAQARTGEIAAARKTANGMQYPAEHFTLQQIALEQARAGDLVGALETVELIPQLPRQAVALESIGWEFAYYGKLTEARFFLDHALEIAFRCNDADLEETFFNGVAFVQAATGQVTTAWETGRRIRDEKQRADALSRVAYVQAASGDWQGALAEAQQESSPLVRANIFEEIGRAIVDQVEEQQHRRAAE